jgi:predicted esterase
VRKIEFHGKPQRQKTIRQFLMASVCVVALVALGAAETRTEPQKETLSFGGENRAYYVFAPSGLAAPVPLLVLLHGSGSDGSSLIDHWQDLAQREGIILAAPESGDPANWGDRENSPDFLNSVLGKIESKYAVDTRRVYVFGYSTGAVYALYLSIVESEYFAATAIYDGFLQESSFKLIDSAERKIPISIWAGTDDASSLLPQVRATRDAFNTRGFTVELHELPAHDQNYDAVAGEVNAAAWEFLKANKLAKDPEFHVPAQLLHPFSKIDSRNQSNLNLELTPQSFDRAVWANAKPYLDEALPQLTADIPELQGLAPAPDQQFLPDLLKKTSDKSLELLKKMPNVISHESVDTKIEPRGRTWHQQFEYLVLRHETNGEVMLDEYRTDKANTGSVPLAQGVANSWVLFHPGNLTESRFRYLGHQRMDGHSTFVLAFAQIPDKVKFPGQVNFAGTTIPVLFQGIAWIDESDFRIVRLRKDLLAPRPDIFLRTLTSEVLFSEIRLPETEQPLWLPQEATTTWDYKGQVVQQLHRYSGFHLYRSKSKIVM